jgi:hypothetical protein
MTDALWLENSIRFEDVELRRIPLGPWDPNATAETLCEANAPHRLVKPKPIDSRGHRRSAGAIR